MSRAVAVFVLAATVHCVAYAALPKTLEEFQQQIAEKARDPRAATKLWLDAVMVYIGGDKQLGEQLITEMSKDKQWKSRSYFVRAMAERPYIFRSYAKGTGPETQYDMDPNQYELVHSGKVDLKPYVDKAEGEYAKLFIVSSGADAPRPAILARNSRGEYKMDNFSSLCVDVRPPQQAKIWGPDLPESTDPVWTFKYWLQGILMYLKGQQEEGLAQMNSVMKRPDPELRSFHGAMGPEKSHLWGSYVRGTSRENGYNVPDIMNFEVDTYFQEGEAPTETSTLIRMFVRSTGADSARPLRLELDDRKQWRINEYSSLCLDVRPPVAPNAGDF